MIEGGAPTLNTIELFGSYDEERMIKDYDECRYIDCYLKIDGKPFYNELCLDLPHLVASTRGSGEYFIFTCTCGQPECAGIFCGIIVTHKGGVTRWKVPRPLQQDSDDDEKIGFDEYVFDRRQYLEAIRKGLGSVQELIQENPFPVEFNTYGLKSECVLGLDVDDNSSGNERLI